MFLYHVNIMFLNHLSAGVLLISYTSICFNPLPFSEVEYTSQLYHLVEWNDDSSVNTDGVREYNYSYFSGQHKNHPVSIYQLYSKLEFVYRKFWF